MYCHILRVRAIPTLESTDSMIYIYIYIYIQAWDHGQYTAECVTTLHLDYCGLHTADILVHWVVGEISIKLVQ